MCGRRRAFSTGDTDLCDLVVLLVRIEVVLPRLLLRHNVALAVGNSPPFNVCQDPSVARLRARRAPVAVAVGAGP